MSYRPGGASPHTVRPGYPGPVHASYVGAWSPPAVLGLRAAPQTGVTTPAALEKPLPRNSYLARL